MDLLTPTLILLAFSQVQAATRLTPDAEFRGVQPPEWVLEGAAKVFLPLDDMEELEACATIGATIVHAGGPALYYPLRRDDPESGLPEPEKSRLIQGIARAKELGLRVVLGVSPYAPIPIVREHPEWILQSNDQARPQELVFKNDLNAPEWIGLRALPLNTPYGDYAIEGLVEIMRDYDVDGFSFDGCYHATINYSPFERALYQSETGKPFPSRIDLNDDTYRHYLLWADEKLEQWYRKLGERLTEIRPDAAIYTWTTNAGRYGHFLTSPRVMSARMNRLFHCPVQEWWLDEINLGATVTPNFGAAYVRAVSGGKVGASEPYLMSRGNPYSTDSFPAHELTVRCLGAMTNGSFTPLAQMAGKRATHATLREIVKRKAYFTRMDPSPWAALLVSEQTRQFYAHGNIMERWLSHALGMYRVGMEEHLPVTLITDLDLTAERLKPFSVLILPNAACLSDDQVKSIREYVAEGGGLFATCETSLCDELGRSRGDFALHELFGTHYGGRPSQPITRPALDVNFALAIDESYWANRGNAGAFRFSDFPDSIFATDPRIKDNLPNGQASFKGPLVRPTEFSGSMKPAVMYFPEGSREPFPCMAVGTHGSGRVVYSSAGIDAAMYGYAFPYQRMLLARALNWAARKSFPITVKAPMCVQSTFWTQGGSRHLIHLWNGINSTSDHGQQDVEVPLREEAIPIHGMEIHVRGVPHRTARCEPEGIELMPTIANDGTQVYSIPPVAIHSVIVLE